MQVIVAGCRMLHTISRYFEYCGAFLSFDGQTARYSLIGGWRCGDINSLSVEVLRWSTPQFAYVYVGSVSWAVRHQSAALLDGPGRMYAFSMQAESLGRKHHIIDIQWESWRGVVWKWLVHTTWRGMYTICYCEQECLGSGWGVDPGNKVLHFDVSGHHITVMTLGFPQAGVL